MGIVVFLYVRPKQKRTWNLMLATGTTPNKAGYKLLVINKQIVDISSLDIYDEDQEKCSDVRSILKMNMVNLDFFMPSHGVIALRPIFAVLW
jgi:6-phosphogluconolactonase/glucosamine-6-phosphate isomerase/deaminase